MKVCIVGAGAIGGFIGARLAAAGAGDVCALARGATLQALRQHGWRLREGERLVQAPARTAERAGDLAAELGTMDLVVVAVKAPAMRSVAESIGPLLGERTIVLPAMNGVPWWFCEGQPEVGATPLHSVDAGGFIAERIAHRRVLGCVVHAAASVSEPGLVQHAGGQTLIIGEPGSIKGNAASERVRAVAQVLRRGGFDVTESDDVRRAVWYKLWGNMTMNPVSALTGATLDRVLADPLVRAWSSETMREAAAVGARIGCPIEQLPEERHAVTAKLGAFKTSMLQDVLANRAIELDAIVGAVHEIGRRVGVPTPQIDALFGLTRLFARQRGLYPMAGEG